MNEDDPIVEHFGGVPITRSQQARMRDGEALTAEIRARASFKSLLEAGPSSGIGVNCARCEHVADYSDEAQRGWCSQLRQMVTTWHNCQCAIFTARTTPKASDALKAQLDRQERERG